MTTVAKDKVVHFYYALTDDTGQMLDASGTEPLGYLHGHSNIVAGLEKQLEGKSVGEEFDAVVTPEEGYGVFTEGAYQSVHRRELPAGTKVEVGAPVRTQGSDGAPVVLWISKIQGARVTITTNHPLAGKTLHFKVQIAAIRDGSATELEHGHVHEPGQSH